MTEKDLTIIKRAIKKLKESNVTGAIVLLEVLIEHYERIKTN